MLWTPSCPRGWRICLLPCFLQAPSKRNSDPLSLGSKKISPYKRTIRPVFPARATKAHPLQWIPKHPSSHCPTHQQILSSGLGYSSMERSINSASPNLHIMPTPRTGYIICWVQCKMKMWGPLFKNYWEFNTNFKLLRISRQHQQSVKPSGSPLWPLWDCTFCMPVRPALSTPSTQGPRPTLVQQWENNAFPGLLTVAGPGPDQRRTTQACARCKGWWAGPAGLSWNHF